MIVAMAVITTLAMPPTLRWALGRLTLGETEKKRLEREEIDQRGFVASLERLLVAVDEGPTAASPPTSLASSARASRRRCCIRAARARRARRKIEYRGDRKGRRGEPRGGEEDGRDAGARSARHSPPARRAALDRGGGEGSAQGLRHAVGRAWPLADRQGRLTRRLDEIAGAFDGPLCLVLKPVGAGRQMPKLGPKRAGSWCRSTARR